MDDPAPAAAEGTERVKPAATTRPLSDLGDGNAGTRSISKAAAAGLGFSLAEFGDLSGVVLTVRGKGLEIVAGHQRLAQLREAGATDWHVERMPEGGADGAGWVVHPTTAARFPVRIVRWSASKAKAARYAANAQTIAGEFTPLALPDLRGLAALPELAPLRLDDLARMISGPPVETVEDEAPAPPVNPVSRKGDLWLLGDHRLLCGDSTRAEDVARVMGGEKAMLMATDPPYLVDYDGTNHPAKHQKRRATSKTAAGTSSTGNFQWDAYKDPDASVEFYRAFLAVALAHLDQSAPVYQWHATRRQALVEQAWSQNALLIHQTIIWAKARGVLTHSHYLWAHEPAFYGWQTGHQPPRDRRPGTTAITVWEIAQAGESDGIHPTQKPVEIFARPIRYHTLAGEVCYEPFSGSGTQIIAAEQLGRRCFAIELAPQYCDVALLRYQNLTGGPVRLALPSGEPGPTFAALAADRAAVLPSEGKD